MPRAADGGANELDREVMRLFAEMKAICDRHVAEGGSIDAAYGAAISIAVSEGVRATKSTVGHLMPKVLRLGEEDEFAICALTTCALGEFIRGAAEAKAIRSSAANN